MRRLVRNSLVSTKVRNIAVEIVQAAAPRDKYAHAKLIRSWVSNHMRFVPDPDQVEMVHSPEELLDQISQRYYTNGDCDDVAVLTAALAKVVGLRARFVVVGFEPRGGFAHVFTIVETPQGWVDMDTTRPRQIPAVLREASVEV